MGVESQQGSYQHSIINTGAANRDKMKNAGYGGVRFRDTKGEKSGRAPKWSDAGIPMGSTKPDTTQYGPQTVAEVEESRSGIAPTAKNMGSLAVQYRADEATAIKAGKLTSRNKRDQKIIDARGVGGGSPTGERAMDAFKEKYWKAREVWAADKGAYSGIVPSGSEVSHSTGSGPRKSSRRLDTTSGSQGHKKYGLF